MLGFSALVLAPVPGAAVGASVGGGRWKGALALLLVVGRVVQCPGGDALLAGGWRVHG